MTPAPWPCEQGQEPAAGVSGRGRAGCWPAGPTERDWFPLLWRHGVAGGSDQDRVRRGDERPPPGRGAPARDGTQRWAAADIIINADGPFLIFFLGGLAG